MTRFPRMNVRRAVPAATLAAVILAGPALAQPVPPGYRLSMETVERCHSAMLGVTRQAGSDGSLRAEMRGGRQAQFDSSTAAMAASGFEQTFPTAAGLLKSGGCPAGEFFTVMYAMTAARVAASPDPMAPKDKAGAVPPENIEFVTRNMARLKQMAAEQREAERAAGIGGPG